MAECIQMPFGIVSGVGRGMGVLDEHGYRRMGRGSFKGQFGASHCKQCMGTLLCSCAEMHEAIELSFGEVSGVGHGMGVVDGSPRAPSGKGGLRI